MLQTCNAHAWHCNAAVPPILSGCVETQLIYTPLCLMPNLHACAAFLTLFFSRGRTSACAEGETQRYIVFDAKVCDLGLTTAPTLWLWAGDSAGVAERKSRWLHYPAGSEQYRQPIKLPRSLAQPYNHSGGSPSQPARSKGRCRAAGACAAMLPASAAARQQQQHAAQQAQPFPLLTLPDLVLQHVIGWLTQPERKACRSSCRWGV